jgi:N-acylneuraminate cytidylyltransferase
MSGNLCIIPARGGSKRLPRKNIKSFFGKPVIEYGITTALASGLFQEVMVSTDDKEIAAIAERCGAAVPFLRNQETADDVATTLDVLREVLSDYSDRGVDFDSVCCLYPVAPLVSSDDLKKGLEVLNEENTECVFPVVQYSHPVQRALEMKNGLGSYVWSDFVDERTQDIQTLYHDAGQWYWLDIDCVMSLKSIGDMKFKILPMPEWRVQDVDDIDDWVMLELKYQHLRQDSGK